MPFGSGALSGRSIAGAIWLLCLANAGMAVAQNVQNYTAPGNLAPTRDPGCIPYAQADNTLTPADLSLGVLACAAQDNYRDAVDLLVLMQLRAAYDSERVADPSAGQAGAVLALNVSQALGEARMLKLEAGFANLGDTGSPWHGAFCSQMQDFGVPEYFPGYMIQHGMRAFTNSGEDPLVAGFEPQVVWQELLASYLECS
ncbi:MAG: hypothetical protein L3J36_15505 [Rhodobacteraceae bacterium]|nr:hypothetical protein [Paracoccaceae bacterium]